MLVRIDLNLAGFGPAESGRQHEAELATASFRVACGEAPLPQQAQLVFRHRPLEPKQQAIVDESGIIGAVWIDDQGARQRAEIDQVMPVPPVAGQARRLDAVHRPDVARADHGDQTLEAGTLRAA